MAASKRAVTYASAVLAAVGGVILLLVFLALFFFWKSRASLAGSMPESRPEILR